jgi:hypothetical protein
MTISAAAEVMVADGVIGTAMKRRFHRHLIRPDQMFLRPRIIHFEHTQDKGTME